MTMYRSFRKCAVKYALLFMFISGFHGVLAQDSPKVLDLVIPSKYEVGQHSTISCSVFPENSTVEWLFNGETLKISNRITQKNETRTYEKDNDGNVVKYLVTNVTISNTTVKDSGDYTCITTWEGRIAKRNVMLDLSFAGKLVKITEGPIKQNATEQANVTLQCVFEVFNNSEVQWWKRGKDDDFVDLETKPPKSLNSRKIESTFELQIKRTEDNGTYICQTYDKVTDRNISGTIDVFVFAAPKVIIDKVKAISASQLFLNWTVYSHNSPIKSYNLMYRKLPSSDYSLYIEKIGKKNTSIVMEGLSNSTEYQLKLEVTTAYGSSHMFSQTVRTLDKDPIFVPNISIKGFSATSVTIGWAPPPDDIEEFIHYYLLEARKKDESASKQAYHLRDSRNLPYMFDDLEPHSTYVFRVCACSEFTLQCGNWSEEMEAVTLDGTPGKPSDVTIHCYQDGNKNFLNLTWEQPIKPNAEIKGYTMELTSNVTYKNQHGVIKFETWGPLSKFVTNDSRSVRFEDLKPNTNYTVRLSAMTRTRRRGEEAARSCGTPPAPPAAMHKPVCSKILDNNRYMFRMIMPRASERNGPICCYRVHMVRLPPNTDWNLLPPPKDIQIVDYEKAHMEIPILGAYITDIFSNEKFPPQSELILGDQNSLKLEPKDLKAECLRCLKKPKRVHQEIPTPKPTVTSTTTSKDDYFDDDTTGLPEPEVEEKRERRSYPEIGKLEFFDKDGDYSKNPMLMDKPGLEDDDSSLLNVTDGFLDPQSNYTIFVELIPGRSSEEPVFSEYSSPQQPAPSAPHSHVSTTTELALQIICVLLGAAVLCALLACALRARRGRKPPHAHVEMNPIQAALRYVVYHMGGRQQLVTTAPPDLPPIHKDDLAAAYAERQADSDYGFQKEFELLQMLPECYPDRTTHASEARENQPKNRYPDIKAYDQTRVKLTQIDSIVGSDYINANYVMGYKERKQFICAQGPTDTTVNDFWRMIWEHGLELIVMLTNLEEYSKVKCSKYWPDEVRGSRAFGNITVHHVSEKRYSDYIVRELKITRQQTNSEGQPIVDNNGVAKRNGDCNNSEGSSAPTSPRENKESSRTVKQYHFLMWKDFAAPEHPNSILKFIKRVNEAWSATLSRPVVVHCSAGVGRSGTLVALDWLLDQLRATDHAAVFNCVRELRRHRNFLVQSLKQYVFVYRALVEYAHYGDTEIPCSRMKTAIDGLRNTPEGADKCLMELEFEKIMNSPLSESVKSCAAGAGEELRPRNRSPECLPYDRNRVILTPIPGREFSTYINASFIEAYDNSEGFIITQDPLPNTIADFWRMISEHNVSTIIMLSGLGEGKCPRYWDDGSAQYEGITVQYEESESCPYYTRRQFRVTHNKSGAMCVVRQLQYQGWPTAAGHVPEVTRGLAELADAADLCHPTREPILMHCQFGTERSALFVALCILICQVRVERRVDVCSVARKVRDQRAHTIDTFLQYEFLHRAILNYAELHNLLEDS